MTAMTQGVGQTLHHGIVGIPGRNSPAADRIQVLQYSSRLRRITPGYSLGVLQKVLQAVCAVVVLVGNVLMPNGSDHSHVILCAGKNDIQPLLSSALVN